MSFNAADQSRFDLRKPPARGGGYLWKLLLAILAVLVLVAGIVVVAVFCTGFAVIGMVNQPDDDPPGNHFEKVANLHELFAVTDLEHNGIIHSLAFSPDGKYLAAGTKHLLNGNLGHWEGTLKVWEVASAKEIYSERIPQWIVSLAFHPDGKQLAVSCASTNKGAPVGFMGFVQQPGEVRLYDFPGLRINDTVKFKDWTDSIRFAPDGKTLAVVHAWGIDLLDFPKLKQRAVIKDFVELPSIVFSPDNTELLATKSNPLQRHLDCIAVFDAADGKFKSSIDNKKKIRPALGLEMTTDGILMTHGPSFYHYTQDRFADEMKGPPSWKFDPRYAPTFAAITPDSQYVVLTGISGQRQKTHVVLLEYPKKELITIYKQENVEFIRCALSFDGKHFAVGTDWCRGIGGKANRQLQGHVLLFDMKDR